MPNKNYQAGTRFEYRTRDRLLSAGFACVTRSAGSKTKIDLVAITEGCVLLVQCKRDGKISPAEREVVYALGQMNPGVTVPVLATTEGFFILTGPGPKDRVPFDPADFAVVE